MKAGRYQVKKTVFYYDRWILFTTLCLLAFGLLMVASSSMVISDRQYGYPLHYVIRQTVFLLFGLAAIWFTTHIPLKLWEKFSGYFILIGVVLLVAVLIPGIGRVVNGSRRWINLGIISLQVSEVVKLLSLLYLASYLARYQNQVQTQWIGFIKPIILLGFIGILLLLEPDFGAVTVIAITFLALLFIAGARLLPFTSLFVLVVAAMGLLAVTSPYRLERLTTFLNPWSAQFGSGYQLTQSLIAFGRGGLFGVGLGNSIQKLFYLPEAHTDFIFAVIGEELGLIGELLLIGLFTLLVVRIISIGQRAHRENHLFSAYLAYGIGIWIALQALINIGVNIGLLPTKGLTLPFISYGGSSMLINSVVVGIMLRMSYELEYVAGKMTKATYHSRSQVGNRRSK